MIYAVPEYLDWENEALELFENFLTEKGEELSEEATTSKKLRFLHGYKFDNEKCLVALKDQLAWEKEYLPPVLTELPRQIIEAGAVYIHGRDTNHRPFIVLDAYRMINLDFEKKHGMTQEQIGEEVLTAIIFVLEYMKNNLHVPGKVENFSTIINLKDVGIT